MVEGGDQAHKPIRSHVTLENVGRALPILGLALPLSGALYRMTSFAVGHPPIPQRVAVTLPVTDLGVVGFGVLWPSVLIGLLLAVLMWTFRLFTSVPEILARRPELRRAFTLGVGFGALLVLILTTVFLDRGISGLLQGIVGTVVMVWLTQVLLTSPRRLPLSRLVGPVLVFALASAFLYGIRTNTAGTLLANVKFEAVTGMESGVYSLLGADGNTTWLLSCTPGSRPTNVRNDLLVSSTIIDFGPWPDDPTMSQMVNSGSIQPAGYVQRCPTGGAP